MPDSGDFDDDTVRARPPDGPLSPQYFYCGSPRGASWVPPTASPGAGPQRGDLTVRQVAAGC